jgi:hypothetical protein
MYSQTYLRSSENIKRNFKKTLMTLLCTFREANVATVTGDAFGNPDCIRFLMLQAKKS